MSTFKHTMMVLDRMHQICEERDIDGNDRVRRLMMAVSHDIGKPVMAKGVHADDPPTRFGGHADTGAEAMDRITDRLGLGRRFAGPMEDAARHHMSVHDIPEMSAEELIGFVANDIQLPDDGAEDPAGATPDEMIDLACADEEGRLRCRIERNTQVTEGGWRIEITDEEQFEEDGPVTVTDETFVPEFVRQPFEERVEAVREAVERVDGFEAMREGLCGGHGPVGDGSLKRVLANCADCRDPGPWIGETIDEMRVEHIEEEIEE